MFASIIYTIILAAALLTGVCIVASIAAAVGAWAFAELGRQKLQELPPVRVGYVRHSGALALAVAWGE